MPYQFNQKIREELEGLKKSKGAKLHLHLPLCIGYGKKNKAEHEDLPYFAHVVEGASLFCGDGTDFSIYLHTNPKNSSATQTLFQAQKDLTQPLEASGQLSLIENWRKNNNRREAAGARYNNIYYANNKEKIDKLIREDLKEFLRRNSDKGYTEQEGFEHIKEEIIDCVALMVDKEQADIAQQPVINILLYEGPVYKSILDAISNEAAEAMGYEPGSLIKRRFELKQSEELVDGKGHANTIEFTPQHTQLTSADALTQLLIQLSKSQTPEWFGKFLAHYTKEAQQLHGQNALKNSSLINQHGLFSTGQLRNQSRPSNDANRPNSLKMKAT